MKFLTVSCMIFIILITSCTSAPGSATADSSLGGTEPVQAPIEHNNLEGNWELVKFEKAGNTIPIVPDTEPNVIGINFGIPTDNIYPVDGFLGVNLFFNGAAFADDKKSKKRDNDEQLEGLEFHITDFSTTSRTGPEEHMSFEKVFKDCLFSSDKYLIKGSSTLILYSSEKDSILTLKKQ